MSFTIILSPINTVSQTINRLLLWLKYQYLQASNLSLLLLALIILNSKQLAPTDSQIAEINIIIMKMSVINILVVVVLVSSYYHSTVGQHGEVAILYKILQE